MPHGISTIEMKITESDQNFVNTKIFPLNRATEKRLFVGYNDGVDKDFFVIWGGGVREGITMNSDSVGKKLFLNLLHVGTTDKNQSLSLYSGLSTLPLAKIELIPLVKSRDVVRMSMEIKSDIRTIKLVGNKIPFYYSRWFPRDKIIQENEFEYYETQIPSIILEFKEDSRFDIPKINSDVTIYLDEVKIAEIGGDWKHSYIHAELFSISKRANYLVLRIWFYWLHENFDKNPILGGEGLSEAIQRIERDKYSVNTPEATLRNFAKSLDIEVPDLERFDLLIDCEKKRVLFVGTDFHYQEMWYRIKDDASFVEAKISDQFDTIVESINKLKYRFEKPGQHNPVYRLQKILEYESIHSFVGTASPISSNFANLKNIDNDEVVRRFGILRKHIPIVSKASLHKDLISSIVTS
jgi:hypothetical protein